MVSVMIVEVWTDLHSDIVGHHHLTRLLRLVHEDGEAEEGVDQMTLRLLLVLLLHAYCYHSYFPYLSITLHLFEHQRESAHGLAGGAT